MTIDQVQTPTITMVKTMDILREEGYEISPDKLKAGICQGVYPWGDVISRTEGLNKNDIYVVYTMLLKKWLEKRRVPAAAKG